VANLGQQIADGLGFTYLRDMRRYAHAKLRQRLHVLEGDAPATGQDRTFRDQLRALNKAPRGARGMSMAGLDGRASGGLPTMPTHPDTAVRTTLRTLRARSRHQVANDPYARKVVREFGSNVVGPTGVTLQSRAVDPNGKPDRGAREAIEKAWALWCRRGCCDVTGGRSFSDVQRLWITGIVQDGESLVRMWHGRQWNRYSLAVQVVDPELVDVDLDAELAGDNHVRMGVELDPWERPAAYYLSELAAGPTLMGYGYHAVRRHRVEADRLLHGFLPDQPGQTRGLPLLSPVLLRMAMLSGFEDAAVMAARIGAAKMGFFTSADGEGYKGQAKDADGGLFMDVEPGTFEQLPHGVDFKGWDPKYPDGDVGPFSAHMLRGVAAGTTVPYHNLAQDPASANYSSLRAFSIEARQVWRIYQDHLVESLVRPVFEQWLRVQLAAGTLVTGKGQLRPDRLDKYLAVDFQPMTWDGVDPLKDAQANLLNVQNGWATPQEIITGRGRDPEAVVAELASWQEMLAAAGLPPAPAVSVVTVTEDEDKPEGAEDAEK